MKRTCALVLLAAGPASAATFPANSAYVPLRCGGAPMYDAFADDPNALGVRDVVGDSNAPAGLRASDAQNLYLRIRLDQDPAPGGTLQPFSWGMEFDLDGDRTTYEVLILVNGSNVSLFTNHTTTIANDGSDPADTPAVATYTFAANGRSIAAPGSNNGGNGDFFLDFAVPWSALTPLGLDRTTPTYVWAASSSSTNSLNGDFACHDAGSGPAHLDGTASDVTTGDPANDTNPPPPGGLHLEGGGGCAAAGGSPGAVLLVGLFLLCRRRARR